VSLGIRDQSANLSDIHFLPHAACCVKQRLSWVAGSWERQKENRSFKSEQSAALGPFCGFQKIQRHLFQARGNVMVMFRRGTWLVVHMYILQPVFSSSGFSRPQGFSRVNQ
jgi:hypothetical protein